MRMAYLPVAIAAALAGSLAAAPVWAADMCPASGQPYQIEGAVKDVGTTHGHPWYEVLDAHCGDEDNVISVYPAAPVADCSVGKDATASGTYEHRYFGSEFGMSIIASLNNATLVCK